MLSVFIIQRLRNVSDKAIELYFVAMLITEVLTYFCLVNFI